MLQQFKVSLKSLKHLADTCGTTTFAVVNAKRELMNYHQQLFKKRRPPPESLGGIPKREMTSPSSDSK